MADGALIFLVIIIVIGVAIAWTSFGRTRRGSGIGNHPVGNAADGAPGAGSPSEADHDHSEQRPADFGTK